MSSRAKIVGTYIQGIYERSRVQFDPSDDVDGLCDCGRGVCRPCLKVHGSSTLTRDPVGSCGLRDLTVVLLPPLVLGSTMTPSSSEGGQRLRRGWRPEQSCGTEVAAVLDGLATDVEVIGSSSVLALLAKPIIDLAVGLGMTQSIAPVTATLESDGWIYRGDAGRAATPVSP